MSRGIGHLLDRVALALVVRARRSELNAIRARARAHDKAKATLYDLFGEGDGYELRGRGRPGYDASTAGDGDDFTRAPVPPGWLQ